MKKSIVQVILATAFLCAGAIATVRGQQGAPLTTEQKEQRWQTEKELETAAIIERKVMVLMRWRGSPLNCGQTAKSGRRAALRLPNIRWELRRWVFPRTPR